MKNLVILLLFACTLSQTCFGISSTNSTVCSSKGRCTSLDYCSCYSGYAGAKCEQVAPNSTCTWNINTQTRTDFYPVIDSTSLDFLNDNLIFSIRSPIVKDRLNTTIFIKDLANTQCKYPGVNAENILELSTPCYNRYNFKIPWNTGKNCGWTRIDYSDKIVYTANIFVMEIENIGYLRNVPIQREIQRVIPITLEFQTEVVVSVTVKVFSPVNMMAAVTKQTYFAGPPSSGLFEFTTSLQYPFILDTNQAYSMTQTPVGLTSSITDISDSSKCLPNQPCNQMFRIPLQFNTACSFTGDYEATFKLACHPSITNPSDCPIDVNNRIVRVVISANSEEFCTAAKVEINLSGNLRSYADDKYVELKNSYLLDTISYFKAEVFSPKVAVKNSKVIRVQWQSGSQSSVLFDNSIVTATGTAQQFALGPSTETSAAFKFILSSNSLNIPVDGSSYFNVSALVQVSYESLNGTQSDLVTNTLTFNQDIMQTQKPVNSQDSKYSERIQVFNNQKSSGSTSFYFSFIILLFFII